LCPILKPILTYFDLFCPICLAAAPLSKKPSSEKLGQADLDALMPGWLETKGASSDRVKPPIVPQAGTRTTRASEPPATEEKVRANSASVV
jgi:hypothetical protein